MIVIRVFNKDKKFDIPSGFTLFGHKYRVLIMDNIYEQEDCFGDADDDSKTIRIQSVRTVSKTYVDEDGNTVSVPVVITPEVQYETFLHELFHIIALASGHDELSDDEKLVNIVGKALLEVYLYSSYDEK